MAGPVVMLPYRDDELQREYKNKLQELLSKPRLIDVNAAAENRSTNSSTGAGGRGTSAIAEMIWQQDSSEDLKITPILPTSILEVDAGANFPAIKGITSNSVAVNNAGIYGLGTGFGAGIRAGNTGTGPALKADSLDYYGAQITNSSASRATIIAGNQDADGAEFLAGATGIYEGVERGSTPANPSAGERRLYAKADGWYDLDSAGTEVGPFGTGGGGSGLTHPQVMARVWVL